MPSIGDTHYTGKNLLSSEACTDVMVLIITFSIIHLCFSFMGKSKNILSHQKEPEDNPKYTRDTQKGPQRETKGEREE